MDAVTEPSVEDGVEDSAAEVEQVSSGSCSALPCGHRGAGGVYADQQCDLKEGQVLQDDGGEILLVQGLQDYQSVISETVVVDDSGQHQSASVSGLSRASNASSMIGPYQQYQPLVVQGFVTSSGEVVHVVQDTTTSGGCGGPVNRTDRLNQPANLPGLTYQHPYQHQQQQQQHQTQPQMMHPDLYRLIKMFPDFSTKTLHRIFVMCRCDLKRSLDQALFARQFRQLDSAQSYSPVAPTSSPHFPPAPYRTPARSPYMQMGVDLGLGSLGDMYQPRGRASHGIGIGTTIPPSSAPPTSQSSTPILLYQQATNMQPLGQHLHDVDDAEVVQIKLADLSSDGQSLGDSLGHSLGLLRGTELDDDGTASLGPGGDSANVERGEKGEESKDMQPDLAEVTVRDSSHVNERETGEV